MRTTAWSALALAGTVMVGCGHHSAAAPASTPALTTTNTTSATTVAAAAPVPPRTVKWVDLQAGDCLSGPPPTDPAVVMVAVVDCAQPHTAETYLRAPIPVNEALADVATSACATGLAKYTGTAAGSSPFTSTYLIDSEQDRTSNNPLPSTVICLLQGADGKPLTGSARR